MDGALGSCEGGEGEGFTECVIKAGAVRFMDPCTSAGQCHVLQLPEMVAEAVAGAPAIC